MTRRSTLLFVAWVTLWPLAVGAQPAASPIDPVRTGDRWIFELKDEISGEIRGTYVKLATEISDREIVTTITRRGEERSQLIVFDRDWNRIDDSTWKYRPNDGSGIRLPLAVGKEWQFEGHASNLQTGVVQKITGSSKVVAQESVTTPAGAFDTFKIETRVRRLNTNDPSRGSEGEIVVWYAEQINHWVRRTETNRAEGRMRFKRTGEVVEFGRKQ